MAMKTVLMNIGQANTGKDDVNILLLGPTGIGKSTFINAFVNYLVYDSFDDALQGEIQAVIPSSFITVPADTFIDELITVGQSDQYENFSDQGQSATQSCRSFVFPIANRKLRIIDTPGIGDTRGLDHDKANMQELLTFISQYNHINGICLLLKPNEERLTVPFQYCVNELLRHLHRDANKNLIFIFTNARATGFKIGATKRWLHDLFSTYHRKHNVEISINQNNTFLFDSEPFRCLALLKNGKKLDDDYELTYKRSWDHSMKIYARFLDYVVHLPVHFIQNMISLNQAIQLIYKLPRPIAETRRIIAENLQLVEKYQKQIIKNPQLIKQGLRQNIGEVRKLKFPRTVCTNDECRQVINDNGKQRIEYKKICHDECYLKGVLQETLADPELKNCSAMDVVTGKLMIFLNETHCFVDTFEDYCLTCGCIWNKHIHITYEYFRVNDVEVSHQNIHDRLDQLLQEQSIVDDAYRQLSEFLHANAMLPFNDAYAEYLQYFIEEERAKQIRNENQNLIVQRLERIQKEFAENMETFRKTLTNLTAEDRARRSSLTPQDVSDLIQKLYALPITGIQIRQQVEGIESTENTTVLMKEKIFELPVNADSSLIIRTLIKSFSTII